MLSCGDGHLAQTGCKWELSCEIQGYYIHQIGFFLLFNKTAFHCNDSQSEYIPAFEYGTANGYLGKSQLRLLLLGPQNGSITHFGPTTLMIRT